MVGLMKYGAVGVLCFKTGFLFCPNGFNGKGTEVLKSVGKES